RYCGSTCRAAAYRRRHAAVSDRPGEVACEECGVSYRIRSYGPVPRWCADCAEQRGRDRANSVYERRSPSRRLTCRTCAVEFTAHTKPGAAPTRCSQCKTTHDRDRRRAYRDSHRSRKPPATCRAVVCVDCGAEFERVHSNGVRRRCVACRAAHNMVRHRRYQPNRDRSPRPCDMCGVLITPEPVGPVANWCRVCAGARQGQQRDEWLKKRPELLRRRWQANKQRRRAAKYAGHVERFSSQEIYERDGWVCGICDQPVDRSRRYPDRDSASLDHIVPLSRGGSHTRRNVQLAHLRCNLDKSDRVADHEVVADGNIPPG